MGELFGTNSLIWSNPKKKDSLYLLSIDDLNLSSKTQELSFDQDFLNYKPFANNLIIILFATELSVMSIDSKMNVKQLDSFKQLKMEKEII